MFKLDIKPTYWVPVVVQFPGESEQKFEVQVRRKTKPEIDAMWEQVGRGELTDRQILRDVVVGWRDVSSDGRPLDFTPENFEAVLDMHPVEECMAKAYAETVLVARIKNSRPPRSIG